MPQLTDLRITPEEAQRMQESGEAIILDVVATHSWNEMPEAVRGAVRMDPDEAIEHPDALPRERAIITYCT